MACESIVLNSVNVGRLNPKLLDRALAALGWTSHGYGLISLNDGRRITIRGASIAGSLSDEELAQVAGRLKQAYSAEVVKATATRNGWALRQTGAFAYEVVK
jgi:hypothetical protein